MRSKQTHERDLRNLLAKLETAQAVETDLIAEILQSACPRLECSLGPGTELDRLIDAAAWVELGLWLIAWELPDWRLHGLSCDETSWCCSIGVRSLAMNWLEDVVEVQHDVLPLAILAAFVTAQLEKTQGRTPSNVAAFTRPEATRPGAGSAKPNLSSR